MTSFTLSESVQWIASTKPSCTAVIAAAAAVPPLTFNLVLFARLAAHFRALPECTVQLASKQSSLGCHCDLVGLARGQAIGSI